MARVWAVATFDGLIVMINLSVPSDEFTISRSGVAIGLELLIL